MRSMASLTQDQDQATGITEKFSGLHQLSNVQPTGKEIGRGSYGIALEVTIPGAVCVAKGYHESLLPDTDTDEGKSKFDSIVKAVNKECSILSMLRHPHIVQFMGICFLPGFSLPLLVMEKLVTDLHAVLEKIPHIPLYLKRSILLDVAGGVTFLHSQCPPIIHRDLTARNVLLSSSMVAKIADLGVARAVELKSDQLKATMTARPGNIVYMPPEANDSELLSKYNESIDVFSFGHLALFTLLQTFPHQLKGTKYVDKKRRTVCRTEVERRSDYLKELSSNIREELQPLVHLVECCLQDVPEERPLITDVVKTLKSVTVETDRNWEGLSLKLVRDVEKVNQDLRDEITLINEQIGIQHQGIVERSTKIEELEQRNKELEERVMSLMQDNDKLLHYQTLPRSRSLSSSPPKMLVEWKKLSRPSYHILPDHPPVTVEDRVYARNRDYCVVVYIPEQDKWIKLKQPPLKMIKYSLAVVLNQLMAVGGISNETFRSSDKVYTWDNVLRKWQCNYPKLLTPRHDASAIGYKEYLIVASGFHETTCLSSVEILDTKEKQWYTATPLPHVPSCSRLTLINDLLCLVGENRAMFKATLKVLVEQAKSGSGKLATVWEHLPETPMPGSKPVVINDHLAVAGWSRDLDSSLRGLHLFDPITETWNKAGELPEEGEFECTVLSSGELILTYSRALYKGKVIFK